MWLVWLLIAVIVFAGGFLTVLFYSGPTMTDYDEEREPRDDVVEVKRGESWSARTMHTADCPFDETMPTDRPHDPDRIYKPTEAIKRTIGQEPHDGWPKHLGRPRVSIGEI